MKRKTIWKGDSSMSAKTFIQERFRFIVSGIVTLFLLVIITGTCKMMIASQHHLLWGIPVIIVSVLDIYFLTRSLLHIPKKIDTRLSTLIISLGTTFGFSLLAVVIIDPQVELPDYVQVIQQIGHFLALLPYPFTLWSLLCLKDCLTVVPEAHEVVAHGIYRYSRHPLYVCYMTWAIANMLIFPYIPMIIASLAQILFLLIRLRREERLLLITFPEYQSYYAKTGILGTLYRGK